MLEKLSVSQIDATESEIVLIVSKSNRRFEEHFSACSKATKSASVVFWFKKSSIYGKEQTISKINMQTKSFRHV